MFLTIEPHEIKNYSSLLLQYFQLRKRVFFDELNWDVPVSGEIERDSYDDAAPTYLLWCNTDLTVVYGGLRLMRTTGPTLLHQVFHATHGRNPALIGEDIWEGTRMCLDEAALARDLPGTEGGRAFSLMFVALCEAALFLGIRTMVSNFEAAMSRIYRRAGLTWKLQGEADGYGRRPVFCAAFPVDGTVLADLRRRHGITANLCRTPVGRRTLALEELA